MDIHDPRRRIELSYPYVKFSGMFNLPSVGQPAIAGCAGFFDLFPQVPLPEASEPGAMQDSIRRGGSLFDTILVNIGCSST